MESNPLDREGKLCAQHVVGIFLYHTWAVGVTILHALNLIAANNSRPTERTTKQVEQLLGYMHTNPTAALHYYTSDMILIVHSNASYLSVGCRRSRVEDHFFLGSLPRKRTPIKLNGNIAITCAILKRVAASAAEAELDALFLNVQKAIILKLTLFEMGHWQSHTQIQVDTTACAGSANNTTKRQ